MKTIKVGYSNLKKVVDEDEKNNSNTPIVNL